jgi:hypothetical protein
MEMNFTVVTEVDCKSYDLIIVLTESDNSYKSEWITNRTIAIRHWYVDQFNRFPFKYPIGPLNNSDGIFSENFIMPVHKTFVNLKKAKRPNNFMSVCILGRNIPTRVEELDMFKNRETLDFNIISNCHHKSFIENKEIVKADNKKRINLFSNISGTELHTVLLNSDFVWIPNHSDMHTHGHAISASVFYALSTLCRLIISKEMNTHLRLKSAIIYEPNGPPIILGCPDISLVEQDLDYFMNVSHKNLNKIIKV